MKNIQQIELTNHQNVAHKTKKSKTGSQNQFSNVVSFIKYSYLVMVMLLLLCAVVELKHIFNIDLFPGIDTPIDNAYYAGTEQLGIHRL